MVRAAAAADDYVDGSGGHADDYYVGGDVCWRLLRLLLVMLVVVACVCQIAAVLAVVKQR